MCSRCIVNKLRDVHVGFSVLFVAVLSQVTVPFSLCDNGISDGAFTCLGALNIIK